MFLLDTNICIYIIKKKPVEVFNKLKALSIGDAKISSITVAELYFGAYNSQFIEKNLKIVESFLIPFDIIGFDEKCAVGYGKIKSILKREGNIIGELDMQIASVALANGLVLVTNNEKEFKRIKGLKVENWVKKRP
ncbi:type II toxin-antitoxin system tRNA(fMet)-specific endonuclease VapC [Hippea jasoniae]|uniref:type II toxin-antitoxin system tRNA(fMet)-specific endonuclease VapC n=1 Tax=Hippea jasoniae TaxID=944479 RepID=UPI000555D750|nr:type II toxin-antitoxin system VapC family toxin [Hippea jasoniae]